MKYSDLKCEYCNGEGVREKNIDGMDCPVNCSFCDGTGIHENMIGEFLDRLEIMSNNYHAIPLGKETVYSIRKEFLDEEINSMKEALNK